MGSLKQFQIGKLLTVFLLGMTLLVTTVACNPGNELGARPDNLPVQLGGQNNPHKMGGDGYTEYKMSTDPSVTKGNQSSLMPSIDQLIASSQVAEGGSGLLYPGSGDVESVNSKDDFANTETQRKLNSPAQIPAVKQPIVNRADPDSQILEKVGEHFEDASEFILDPAENSSDRAKVD
ncbi:MAG: hypothetical protein HC881_09790 [Leptolyngbyaceae cyanobacterium SL_7_1]|nr:hypothetical protein [Leptolyngbyaceae cyanobacterium SL_7_1]